MVYQTLIFDIDNSIARIVLNRPEAANSMNMQMMEELLDVSIVCDEDDSIRAVTITGTGRMFCAGGDLASFAKQGDKLPGFLKKATTVLHGAITRFARMKKPVITIINGSAAGAGFSLAIMGDYTIAADSAKFTMAYTAAGLSPDGSSSYFLPRLVGEKRAREIMMTNRTLTADEALNWGMINQISTNDDLTADANIMINKLASGPTLAYGTIKELLVNSATSSLETQMEHESRGIAASAGTVDGKEGIDAFLNKRRAEFGGK
jgi:2-(1,2-epoxy-1,2-dihydrophenyl)acetyl-CoA isomerase